MIVVNLAKSYRFYYSLQQPATPGGVGDVKIADFGLSALVRIDEDGYDAEESGKRKRYRQLKDVRCVVIVEVY